MFNLLILVIVYLWYIQCRNRTGPQHIFCKWGIITYFSITTLVIFKYLFYIFINIASLSKRFSIRNKCASNHHWKLLTQQVFVGNVTLCGKIPKMDIMWLRGSSKMPVSYDYCHWLRGPGLYTTSHQPPHVWQQQRQQQRNLHVVVTAQTRRWQRRWGTENRNHESTSKLECSRQVRVSSLIFLLLLLTFRKLLSTDRLRADTTTRSHYNNMKEPKRHY